MFLSGALLSSKAYNMIFQGGKVKHGCLTRVFLGLRGQPQGYEEPAEEPLSV